MYLVYVHIWSYGCTPTILPLLIIDNLIQSTMVSLYVLPLHVVSSWPIGWNMCIVLLLQGPFFSYNEIWLRVVWQIYLLYKPYKYGPSFNKYSTKKQTCIFVIYMSLIARWNILLWLFTSFATRSIKHFPVYIAAFFNQDNPSQSIKQKSRVSRETQTCRGQIQCHTMSKRPLVLSSIIQQNLIDDMKRE